MTLSAEAALAMQSWDGVEAVGLGFAFFILGFAFKVAVTRISAHNLFDVIALLDTDLNGKIDREELDYVAKLVINDRELSLPSLLRRIEYQERCLHCWEAMACVLLLVPLVLPALLYQRLGAAPARLLGCGLLCLLPPLFCAERAVQHQRVAGRLKKQKKRCREAQAKKGKYPPTGTFDSPAVVSRETVREVTADGRVVREVVTETVRSPGREAAAVLGAPRREADGAMRREGYAGARPFSGGEAPGVRKGIY